MLRMARRQLSRTLGGSISSTYRRDGAESEMTSVTCALFGCTGNVGRMIQYALCSNRFTCVLPYRFRTSAGGSIRGVRYFGDGTCGQNFATDFELDKEFVVKAIIEKVDHVYNAITSWQEPTWYQHSDSWYSMEAVNVEWPRLLARWCREMGVLRFVHISMVGADVNSPSKLLRQKALAEQAVLEEFPTATIIRSTDMFWEEDWTYHKYLKCNSQMKVIPVVNNGRRIHQPVFAGDIGEACARAVLLDHTMGRIAELGGPVRFTTTDLCRWASEVNGLHNFVVHLPTWMWRIASAYHERGPLRRGGLIGSRGPSWNQDWVDRQFVDNCATPERDPNLLDWEDFGIAKEDLYRIEETYFVTTVGWTKNDPMASSDNKQI